MCPQMCYKCSYASWQNGFETCIYIYSWEMIKRVTEIKIHEFLLLKLEFSYSKSKKSSFIVISSNFPHFFPPLTYKQLHGLFDISFSKFTFNFIPRNSVRSKRRHKHPLRFDNPIVFHRCSNYHRISNWIRATAGGDPFPRERARTGAIYDTIAVSFVQIVISNATPITEARVIT